MNAICNEMLRGAKALGPDRLCVHEGTRVASCERIAFTDDRKGWKLFGDELGHEQANAQALKQSAQSELGEFDEIVFTDHMAVAMPSWHPCHVRGLEEAVPQLVSSLRHALNWDEEARRFRAVQPLFTCMVALDQRLEVDFDAASVVGSDVLQWVCRQDSRPHDTGDQIPSDDNLQRWVLVSTPEFASICLESEGMSKTPSSTASLSESTEPVEYIPQTDKYLRADPADQMWEAFVNIVRCDGEREITKKSAVFLKCQRWGAAFAQHDTELFREARTIMQAHETDETVTVCGDFVPRDDYHGDNFVIQDAAISGMDAARRIAARLK